MSLAPNPSPIQVQQGQNWSCHQSGLCCSTFAHIPVDQAAKEVMETHDYQLLREKTDLEVTGFEEGVEAAPDESRVSTGLKLRRYKGEVPTPSGHRGACVFHCADQACGLHKVFGERGKPQLCRDFPYRFRSTPSGTFVGLSFVCPSVRGNLGQSLTDKIPQLETHAQEAFAPETHHGTVLLSRRLSLTWDQYLKLEDALRDLFERPALPLALRLRALQIFTGMIELLHRETHPDAAVPMADTRPMDDLFLQEALDALQRDQYATVFRVASRSVRPSMLLRMFLGMMTGFASSLWTPRNPWLVGGGIFLHYARHSTGLGAVRMRPLPKPVPHSILSQSRFPAPTTDASRFLERYISHILFRKDLAFAPTLRRGIDLLLVNMALIRWYATANAFPKTGGQQPPQLEDWSEAVRYTETFFGLNSRLYQRLSDLPILEAVLDSFLHRREFPFHITAEPPPPQD